MNNIFLALSVLSQLAEQVNSITALITRARAEGRDITDEELDALRAKDDAARTALADAIAKARNG